MSNKIRSIRQGTDSCGLDSPFAFEILEASKNPKAVLGVGPLFIISIRIFTSQQVNRKQIKYGLLVIYYLLFYLGSIIIIICMDG